MRLPRLGPAAIRDARIISTALVAVIVVLGTLTGLYAQGYLHARAVANAKDAALTAAKIGVPRLASYNYTTFDADVRSADKYLTKKYRTQYDDFQQKAVKAPAVQYKAKVVAEIARLGDGTLEAGAVSGGTDRVQLLVFLNQTTTNSKLSAPKIAQSRLRVDMHKESGRWLIAQVTAF